MHARVLGRGPGDERLELSQGGVVTVRQQPRVSAVFRTVFPEQAPADEVYARVGRPLTTAFVDGHNACLLLLGESQSGRTRVLAGDGPARDGLITPLAAQLFAALGGRAVPFSLTCQSVVDSPVGRASRASR